MWLIYYTQANTRELECMAWDVMQNSFHIDLTVKKDNIS